MNFDIAMTKEDLGARAAKMIAEKMNGAIQRRGYARIVLSTGASQFDTIAALVKEDVDWGRVTMFHLDEYVGLQESHAASFRKYLKERFVTKANGLKEAVFVNGEGDIHQNIAMLTKRLREDTIDVGVIGIGENCHIAFNDPPANFDIQDAYIVVDLDEQCKRQQVGEGWFATLNDVPRQAITMTPYQIMQCQTIVSPVPYKVKADAIRKVLAAEYADEMVPASCLKTHPDFHLFVDRDSSSGSNAELIRKYHP
ncbi:MAG: 6-phosphogluconolactonase [Clostridia bacterium]